MWEELLWWGWDECRGLRHVSGKVRMLPPGNADLSLCQQVIIHNACMDVNSLGLQLRLPLWPQMQVIGPSHIHEYTHGPDIVVCRPPLSAWLPQEAEFRLISSGCPRLPSAAHQ